MVSVARHSSPPQADVGAPGLSESISRLRRAMRRGARVADPANTLTVAQHELLACVAEHPGARPGELARLLRLAPNTVTTLINALMPQGLISRSPAADDRRAVAMDLTKAGQEAVRGWQSTNAAILALAVSELPPAQRRALAKAVPALDALARAIDSLADDGTSGSGGSSGGTSGGSSGGRPARSGTR